jgi:hypothetical protein
MTSSAGTSREHHERGTLTARESPVQGRCQPSNRPLTVNPSRKLRRFESFTRHTHPNGPVTSIFAVRGRFSLVQASPGRNGLFTATQRERFEELDAIGPGA